MYFFKRASHKNACNFQVSHANKTTNQNIPFRGHIYYFGGPMFSELTHVVTYLKFREQYFIVLSVENMLYDFIFSCTMYFFELGRKPIKCDIIIFFIKLYIYVKNL